MKLPHLLLSGVAAAALALPVAVVAQTAPAAPPAGAQAGEHHGPGMMRMMRSLNLTAQQQQQMQSLMQQYRSAHPEGSPPDPAARKQLHEQMMAILTPQQQAQLKTLEAQRREQWKEHREQDGTGAAPAATPTPAA